MSAWRWLGVVTASLVIGAALSGCATVAGGPDRLYSVSDEVSQAQAVLPDILKEYNNALTDLDRMHYRNEYIARRMYIIDVEYSAYEAALTSERQKFQFASSVTGEGLSTAGALVASGGTSKILSGLAGAVGAGKGFYDSDLVIAKTLQIAEAQMRAQRDAVAARILQRRVESAATYPLSGALLDLEDYYRAGTLNSGLIAAAGDASAAEQQAMEQKQAVTIIQGGGFSPNEDTTRRAMAYFSVAEPKRTERLTKMSACLRKLGLNSSPLIYSVGDNFVRERLIMIKCAEANKDPM